MTKLLDSLIGHILTVNKFTICYRKHAKACWKNTRLTCFSTFPVSGAEFILRCLTVICAFTLVSASKAQAEITNTQIITDTSVMVSYTISLSSTIATVDSAGLNIRKGPAEEYDWRATLIRGEQVTIQGKTTQDCLWVYAKTPPNKHDGWVNTKYLRNDKGNIVYEDCPRPIKAKQPHQEPSSTDEDDTQKKGDGRSENSPVSSESLIMGILGIFIMGLLFWLAYTRGLLSRINSTPTEANNTIPKAGTPYLEYGSTSSQPRYYPLNRKEISIGRDEGSTLVIDEQFGKAEGVSQQHARIERDGDAFVIVDLDSKNGVFVDDQRTQENVLYDGMRVRLGEVEFIFRLNTK